MTTEQALRAVQNSLRGRAFRFRYEADLHRLLADCFTEAGLAFEHERRSTLGRFDFFLTGGVVLEVKVRGSLTDAVRQAERYTEDPDVTGVIILSTRPWSMTGLTLRGKPVLYARVSRSSF